MIRVYHEYKSIWTDPTLGEELQCKREPGNPHDTHAVAVIKTISRSNVTVGHLPRSTSPICSIFIRRGGTITSRVNGTRRYSADIPQGGLEIPCVLTFLATSFKEGNKTKQLLEATLSLTPVELNVVSETDEGQLDMEGVAELGSDISTEVDVNIKSEPTDECTVDLTDLGHVEADASPPSKRARLGNIEEIIMGKELTDIEINLAQQLLKSQFPEVNGLQSTLLQGKQTVLTEKSVHGKIQIIHCKRRHHWVVATAINYDIYEVKVFDSLYTFSDKETEATINNLFQWDSTKVSVTFSRCQKQIGGVDCGLFAIAFATALAYGKQASKMRFVQEELRAHFVNCINKGAMSLFPCE